MGILEFYRMFFFKDIIIDVMWVGWLKGVLSRVGFGVLGKYFVMVFLFIEFIKLGSGVCRVVSCWWILLVGLDFFWKLWIGKYIFGKGYCVKYFNFKFIGFISN